MRAYDDLIELARKFPRFRLPPSGLDPTDISPADPPCEFPRSERTRHSAVQINALHEQHSPAAAS